MSKNEPQQIKRGEIIGCEDIYIIRENRYTTEASQQLYCIFNLTNLIKISSLHLLMLFPGCCVRHSCQTKKRASAEIYF